MRNNEVLHRFKEERNILHTVKRSKAKWIDHILCKNRFVKKLTERKLDVTGRRGRRRKEPLDDEGNVRMLEI